MTFSAASNDIDYTQSKVAFFETETEKWLVSHQEAQSCQDSENFIRDANVLLQDMLRVDQALQMLAFRNDFTGEDALDTLLRSLLGRWLAKAQKIEARASNIEAKGYEVDGVRDLRHWIAEVAAILSPSDVVGRLIADCRDRAIESDERGETVEGLID